MSNQQSKISVIIPCYNEERHIQNCLNSILNQTYKNIEIIVIDDGSTDKTLDILSEFQSKNLKFKIIEQNHKGPAIARNKAAKIASGDILVFVDADMTFSGNFINDLVSPIIEEKYKGTFSKEEYISNWDNVWSKCWNINQNWPHQKMIPDDYPDEGLDFRAIIKDEFLRIGGFDDVGYTDTWTLSKKLGYQPHSVKGAKYFHANPDNLGEVFIQSKWSAKREYKYGWIGKLYALLRYSLPVSLIIGFLKSLIFKIPEFVLFKIVYDLGGFIGILEMIFIKKLSK